MRFKSIVFVIAVLAASATASWAGLVNEKAPDIALPDLSGKTVELKDFKGRVVFVDFWSTYCGSCKYELPEINKLVERHKGAVVALVISIDKKKAHVEDYLSRLSKFSVDFHVLLDTEPKVMPAYNGLMPSSFIIDKEGVVRFVHMGYRENDPLLWEREVDGLLKQ